MERDAVLINFARADSINQAALVAALRDRRIAAAVLDVPTPSRWRRGIRCGRSTMRTLPCTSRVFPRPPASARGRTVCPQLRTVSLGEAMEAQVDLKLGY